MPGLVGAACDPSHISIRTDLMETIDPLHVCRMEEASLEEGFIASAYLEGGPLHGKHCYEDDAYVAAFDGDLVETERVPWNEMLGGIESRDFGGLARLRGNFAIAVWEKRRRILYLATDSRAQHQVCYTTFDGGILFSTEMSTFCRLTPRPTFSRDWFYQMMFFNWPLWETTFLKGVHTVPSGSLLVYDAGARSTSVIRYAQPFKKREPLLKDDQALETAHSVFLERVPRYFEGGCGPILLGLSGGWDSRVILSLCPKELLSRVVAYTYGIKGCDDIEVASEIARAIGLRHEIIYFDEGFVSQLPELMAEAVFYSSGQQSAVRAAHVQVLKTMSRRFKNHPINVTGVTLDHSFRGSAHVPEVFSHGVHRAFTEGKPAIDETFFREVFHDDYSDFAAQAVAGVEAIIQRYGDLRSSECHLNYLTYTASPNFFRGHMKIANHFSIYRPPSWDDDLLDLSYQVECSRLTFSPYVGPVDYCRQARLHTYLLRLNPDLARLQMAGYPLWVWWKGGLAHKLYRLLVNGPRTIISGRARCAVPLTDWKAWLNTSARDMVFDLLFSRGSLIRNYVSSGFLEKLKQMGFNEPHWIGKLITSEIILRQIKAGWREPIP
jgi:hypothetical protein